MSDAEGTTERILQIAYGQFAERGFRKTTLTSVAREAGVSRPTIYARFDSKEALLGAVVRNVHSEALARAERASGRAGSLEDRLAAMLAAYYGEGYARMFGQPHLVELVGAHGELVRAAGEEGRAEIRALFRSILPEGAPRSKARAVDLLVMSPAGLKADAPSPAAYRARLRALARAVACAAELRR